MFFCDSRLIGSQRGLLRGTLMVGGFGLRRGDCRFRSGAAFLRLRRFGGRFHGALLLGDSGFVGHVRGLFRGPLWLAALASAAATVASAAAATLLSLRCFGGRSRRALFFCDSRLIGSQRGLLRGTLLAGGFGLRRGDCRFRSGTAFLGAFRFRSGFRSALLLGDSGFVGHMRGLFRGPLMTGGFGLRRGRRRFRSGSAFLGLCCFSGSSRRTLFFCDSRLIGSQRGLLRGTLLAGAFGLRLGDRRFRSGTALLGGLCIRSGFYSALLLGDSGFVGHMRGLFCGPLLTGSFGLRRFRSGSAFLGLCCFSGSSRRTLFFCDSRLVGSQRGLLGGTLLTGGFGLRRGDGRVRSGAAFLCPRASAAAFTARCSSAILAFVAACAACSKARC